MDLVIITLPFIASFTVSSNMYMKNKSWLLFAQQLNFHDLEKSVKN